MKISKTLKRPMFYIIIIAAIFRIILGQMLGVCLYGKEVYDDAWGISAAFLPGYFSKLTDISMIKEMSLPLFYDFVHITGLSYTMVLSLVWILAALLVMNLFSRLTTNRVFPILVYLFVLFTPIAFDLNVGTRMYRNALIPPFILIFFTLILMVLFKILQNRDAGTHNYIGVNVILGIVFTFSYYIKEDGIWLLACLLFWMLVCIGIVIFRYVKKRKKVGVSKATIKMVAVLFIPLVLFAATTNIYKAVNYKYFGAYETNMRTSGEPGKFVNLVYKIKSGNRTPYCWAPADAIEKAFAASETLQQYPELLDNILHSPWFNGNIYETPIRGDFLTWVLRTALESTGNWKSEGQINDLFRQVNAEIEEAFDRGDLQRDDKFQLVSSAGGRSMNEIFDLMDDTLKQYKIHIFLDGYIEGGLVLVPSENIDIYEKATALTNTNLLPVSVSGSAFHVRDYETELGNKVTTVVFKIYSVINPVLCVMTVIGFIAAITLEIGRARKKIRLYNPIFLTIILTLIVLVGISLVYAFGISWFSNFIYYYDPSNTVSILKFYSVGLVPLLTLIELFGTYLFGRFVKSALIKIIK